MSFRSTVVHEYARTEFIKHSPLRNPELKQRVAAGRKAGLYKYDYKKVSQTLKNTLSKMSKEDMQQRLTNSIQRTDPVKKSQAIKKGKGSQFRLTQHDGSTMEFWSYDDVRSLTGVAYPTILLRIRKHNGILVDGRKVECLHKFNKSNTNKPRSKLLLVRTDGSQLIFDPTEDVKAITGYSLCTIRQRILKHDGLLSNGSQVSYIQKYNRQK